MKKDQDTILILGADGQQGVIATEFLARRKSFKRILLADIYDRNLACAAATHPKMISYRHCDHRRIEQVRRVMRESKAETVLNCAHDLYHDNVYQAALAERVNLVDLGSGTGTTTKRRMLELNKPFIDHGLTSITGMGSVPGIGNVMLQYLARDYDRLDKVRTGFAWDSNMKDFVSPFFLYGVLQEISQPAEIVRRGKFKTVPSMSLTMTRHFRGVGRQTTYAVSHAEVATFHHHYAYLGLKDIEFYAGFPEHSRNVIEAMTKLGFQGDHPVLVAMPNGKTVSIHPCDFLTPIVKNMPTPVGYTERENLWTEVTGKRDGKKVTQLFECVIPPLPGWEDYGCNIDTAFPACIAVEMIREGMITQPGMFAPEAIIPSSLMVECLKQVGFQFYLDSKRV